MFRQAVALTGGIATGKSTAATILSLLGFRIIDADKIAREILENEKSSVKELFGDRYIGIDGNVDRKALGKLVFSDKTARKKLEALLHPLIRKEIERRSAREESFGKPYLVDIPLFFESGYYPIKHSIVVYAPKEVQLLRFMEREGLKYNEALRKVETQMDIEEKKQKAT